MISQIDDKTLGLLSLLLPDFNPVVQPVELRSDSGGNIARLDLPLAHGADYLFRLWFYPNGERQIGVKLTENSNDGAYFWYRPFELGEFGGSDEDLVSAFCEELAYSRDADRAAKRLVILAFPMRIPGWRQLEISLQSICISRRIQTASNKWQEASLSVNCSCPVNMLNETSLHRRNMCHEPD